MGNGLGRNNRSNYKELLDQLKDGDEVETRKRKSGTTTRVKVRMTVKQLEELVGQVDMSKGTSMSELGQLIMQNCLQGNLSPSSLTVVPSQNDILRNRVGLSTIPEEKKYY